MTIEIKVPSGSEKKFFEMADDTYERRKASSIFNFASRLDEARLIHKVEGKDGVVAHVYRDDESYCYAVKLKKDGKMLPGGTPNHYEDDDKESAIQTATHMANNYKLNEAYSVPTGLSGNLAAMFGVHTQPAASAKQRDKNDKVDPETQELGQVADPSDLAVKIHAALPGMTRKAISVEHILSALKSGIGAADVNRLSQSAVGRKRLRSCCESVDDTLAKLIEQAADDWTVEFNTQSDGCIKYTIRDGDDAISEGVNFTQSAAMLMASREVDSLKASLEEAVLQLKEETDVKSGQAARVLDIAKSMAHK